MKNKTILIGQSGCGKTIEVMNIAKKSRGTTIIVNGCRKRDSYLSSYPFLKEYIDLHLDRSFSVEIGKKYYVSNNEFPEYRCGSSRFFTDELMHKIFMSQIYTEKEKKFMSNKSDLIIFDDGIWTLGKYGLKYLWQLSHAKARIVITAECLEDVFQEDNSELNGEMVKDITRYWNIINLSNGIKTKLKISK